MVTPRFPTRWLAPCHAIGRSRDADPSWSFERVPLIGEARFSSVLRAVGESSAVAVENVSSKKIVPAVAEGKGQNRRPPASQHAISTT